MSQLERPAVVPKYDPTTPSGVQAYLSKTPFACHTATLLSGGTANYAFRIRLVSPYEDQNTLVLKHAKPYIKNYHAFAFDLERQVYEVEALKRIKSWLSPDSIVTVPEIYHFDEQENVMILQDCGEGVLNLKEFLQKGRLSSPAAFPLAEDIGRELGTFIASMHKWSHENPDVIEVFAGNRQAKTISAWATWGRLESTFGIGGQKPEFEIPALTDPPMALSERQIRAATEASKEMVARITDASDYFVMGDFWPGNVMITVKEDQMELDRIYILDWELAKPGLPGVEIGQFCAEIDCVRICDSDPVTRESASKILDSFLAAYSQVLHPDLQLCKDALMHWGCHLAIWTPRNQWGNKDLMRQIAETGLEYVVAGFEKEKDLAGSPVRLLLPTS